MSKRITEAFKRSDSSGRAAFIPYICAGDPDFERSYEIASKLMDAGIDILEVGMPFSDPVADGPVNQAAAQRALESGMTVEKTLEWVKRLREKYDTPIVLYTYYNLIFARGHERFAADAVAAGVDGVLALDCPPEEAAPWVEASRSAGLDNIFIVSPTTGVERLAAIAKYASGFIYYVSRLGVTGERDGLSQNIAERVEAIKSHIDLPVAVGFGISTPDHVRSVAAVADAVVVGSALVKRVDEHADNPAEIAPSIRDHALAMMEGLS